VVERRRQELQDLLALPPGSLAWSAAVGGFEGGMGRQQHPPGYVDPDPAILVDVDRVLDGFTVTDRGLEGQRQALDSAGRILDGSR